MAREGIAQNAAVLGEYVGITLAELVQQTRRALNVREEERDGSGRKVAHVKMISLHRGLGNERQRRRL